MGTHHHTVPVMYLRAFCSRGQTRLHVLDLGTGEWRAQRPEKVAKVRGFYGIDLPGEHPGFVEEQFLGRIESEAAPVLRKIRRGQFPLDGEELGHLVAFVAAAHVRTTGLREKLSRGAHAFAKAWIAEMVSDQRACEESLDQARAEGVEIGDLDYEGLQRISESDDIRFDVVSTFYNIAMMDGWRKVFDSFAEREWSVLRAPASAGQLVTSDDPLSMYTKSDFQGPINREKLASRNVGVVLPIDPHTAIVGDHDFGPTIRPITLDEVAAVNAATVLPGRKLVFGATRSFRWLNPRTGQIQCAHELQAEAAHFLEVQLEIEGREIEQRISGLVRSMPDGGSRRMKEKVRVD